MTRARQFTTTAAAALLVLAAAAPAGAGKPPEMEWRAVVTEADHPAATGLPSPTEETRRYPVGSKGSDVRPMLKAVREGTRADIPIPATFGDLAVEVTTRHYPAAGDWDGDGRPDELMVRTAVVPDLDEKPTTVSWLVALPAGPDGTIGPDEEKRGVVLYAAAAPGAAAPFTLVALEGEGPVATVRVGAGEGATHRRIAVARAQKWADDEAIRSADRRLVETASLVFDRLVLAPETSYVKAFIRKEFQAEVEQVEPVRGLAVPEILRPLYGALQAAEIRLRDVAAREGAPPWAAKARDLAHLLVGEADLSLRYGASEFRYRVEALQKLSKAWRDMEAALSFDGKPLRRVDFETRIAETDDAAERLRLAETYERAFAPLYAEDGGYAAMISKLNEIARSRGYRNYADMRVEEVFGVDGEAFRSWIEDAFATTEAPAKAFIEELREQKGGGDLGYWEAGHLKKAWLERSLGVREIPKLSEQQARAILVRHLADLGFDLASAPYDRITMDWYQDPLKQDASGVAATATPREAYFTSNLRPGQPIPLNEYETVVHETLHTIHYQTSGEASGGSSAWQNLMYSYIAEGITMSGESLPVATPALMERYFSGLEGFTPELMKHYPEVTRRAEAWDLRRLLVMALMEVNLYEDRHADGSERPWKERLAYWPQLLAERLWVVPDGITMGQILCRMHPTAEQHQLMYASYPLGRILVGQLRDALVKEGTPDELRRYGDALRTLMARGALADEPYVRRMTADAAAH